MERDGRGEFRGIMDGVVGVPRHEPVGGAYGRVEILEDALRAHEEQLRAAHERLNRLSKYLGVEV